MSKITCQICSKQFFKIDSQHLNKHGITKEQYLERFPNSVLISDEYRKKLIEVTTGVPCSEEKRNKISSSLINKFKNCEKDKQVKFQKPSKEKVIKPLLNKTNIKNSSNKELIKELKYKTYLNKLRDCGIILIGQFINAKSDIQMQCMICDSIFNNTISSRLQAAKVYGSYGCPDCNIKKSADKKRDNNKSDVLSFFENKKIKLLSDYCNITNRIPMQCMQCDNTWDGIIEVCMRVEIPCKNCRHLNSINKRLIEKQNFKEQIISKPKINPFIEPFKKIGLQFKESYKDSKSKHLIECLVCNHEWMAFPKSKIQAYKKYGSSGCPNCNRLKIIQKQQNDLDNMIKSLNDRGYDIIGEYDLSKSKYGVRDFTQKVLIKRNECGHIWEAILHHVSNGLTICKICNNKIKASRMHQYNNQRHEKFLLTETEWNKYKSEVNIYTRSSVQLYPNIINPNKFTIGRAGTPGAYHIDHILPKYVCFKNNIPAELCGHVKNLQTISWEENLKYKAIVKEKIPPIFSEYISHNEITKWFKSQLLYVSGIELDKDVDGEFFDIVYDKLLIKFLTFGKYRFDNFHNRMYFNNVYKKFTSLGYKVLFFYEDELYNIPNIIKSKILHLAGLNKSKTIHARKCIIKPISKVEKSIFLQKNHIQGSDNSNIHLGAFYNNNLIAVMTLTNSSFKTEKHQQQNNISYILTRFATDINYKISGILPRLMKYFMHNYDWCKISTYADMRISDGKIYEKNGFINYGEIPVSYYYIVDGERKDKTTYRKRELKIKFPHSDINKSEYQIMLENGYDKIHDCGKLKFVKYNDKK